MQYIKECAFLFTRRTHYTHILEIQLFCVAPTPNILSELLFKFPVNLLWCSHYIWLFRQIYIHERRSRPKIDICYKCVYNCIWIYHLKKCTYSNNFYFKYQLILLIDFPRAKSINHYKKSAKSDKSTGSDEIVKPSYSVPRANREKRDWSAQCKWRFKNKNAAI